MDVRRLDSVNEVWVHRVEDHDGATVSWGDFADRCNKLRRSFVTQFQVAAVSLRPGIPGEVEHGDSGDAGVTSVVVPRVEIEHLESVDLNVLEWIEGVPHDVFEKVIEMGGIGG